MASGRWLQNKCENIEKLSYCKKYFLWLLSSIQIDWNKLFFGESFVSREQYEVRQMEKYSRLKEF